MEELKLPELIDTTYISHKPVKKVYKRESQYDKEYIKDSEKLLIKSNIMNMISLIDDCDEPAETKRLHNILKNMIILHGKQLINMPEFILNVERVLKTQESCYEIYVLFKILHNIKFNSVIDNIHFRYVEQDIECFPPIPPEERAILEKKIKYITFTYQAKKKQDAFKVGQIVGAKDKENKWWLSRILHVYNDPQRDGFWYYVRFEGWGELHDEWIYSETYRVRRFNPRKHFLKK